MKERKVLLDREQAISESFIFDYNRKTIAANDTDLAAAVLLKVIT